MNIKLFNGDCLEVMEQLIKDGIKVDLVLCDLPYGTTRNKWDSCIDLKRLWELYNKIVKENGCIALFAQTPFDKVLGASNLSMLRYEWIWQKEMGTGFLNAKRSPLKNHENILIFYKKLPTYNPQMLSGTPYKCKQGANTNNTYDVEHMKEDIVTVNTGERYPVTIIPFSRDKNKIHPTQKPVAIMEYFIKTYTNENELVLDNCMGSGTTGVACKNLNRNFIGIELDKKYFDIAKERIESGPKGLFD